MDHTQIQKILFSNGQTRLPRGELWLGTKLCQESGLEDNLYGHIQLRKQLGMDLLFLPVSGSDDPPDSMDYRYYSPDDVKEAVAVSNLFVGIIVDGPFQRMVSRYGLTSVLMALKKNEPQFSVQMKKEADEVMRIVSQCLEMGIGVVVIADDLAYQHATYMSPGDTETLILGYYPELVSLAKSKGVYTLLHSCGNISGVLDSIVKCGFKGLAACQGQCLDLVDITEKYKGFVLLAGIDSDLLESDVIDAAQKKEFEEKILSLAKGGGLILASSCGLNSLSACQRLRKLYEIADVFYSERGRHV